MKSFLGIIGLFFLCVTSGFAQTEMSLQACIDLAKSKNIQLLQGQLAIDNGQIQLTQSKMNRMPSLNASAGHAYNFGRSIDPFTNQYNNQTIQSNSFSLNTGVVLFSGFQLKNSIIQSGINLKISEKDLEVLHNNVLLSVSSLYLQTLLNHSLLKNADIQLAQTQAQLERTRILFENGTVSRSSLVNLEAQLESDRSNRILAENNLRSAYVQLATLLQWEDYGSLKIIQPDLSKITISESNYVLTDILQSALSGLPEVEREKLRFQSAEMSERIAKGALYPRLTFFANLNTVYSQSRKERYDVQSSWIPVGVVEGTNQAVLSPISVYKLRTTPFGNQLSDNFGQGLGINLSIPIYNNHRVINNIALSQIQAEQSRLSMENTKQTIRNDVITAFANFENAKAQWNAAVKNLEAQNVNYEFSKESFESGMLNSTDLINAGNVRALAQSNLIRSQYEYVFRRLILDFYLGKPLSIGN